MNIQDRKKSFTAEELRQRYNFEDIAKTKKATELIRETLNKVDVQFQRFMDIIKKSLNEYPSQADGNITAWFFNGIPSSVHPEFTTPSDHLGDVYYDRDSGKAYRFETVSGSNQWVEITDARTIEVLAIEGSAPDTSDYKRVVYITQPEPTYSIGDIWINDGKYYRCRAKRIGEFEIYGETTQSETPTPSNPIPIINKTGTTVEDIGDRNYQFNLGDIELCKIDNFQDKIKKGTGKNLLKIPDGYTNSFGGLTFTLQDDGGMRIYGTRLQSGRFYIDFEEPIVMNGDYTFSLKCVGTTNANANQQWLLRAADDTSIFSPTISSNTIKSQSANKNITATKLEIFTAANATIDMVVYPQLEKNTTYTEWEPYGAKDKWLLHKEIGKLVLDGSEDWIQAGTRYHINLDGYNNGTYKTISNYFKQVDSWAEHASTNYSIIIYKDSTWTSARLSINDSDFTGMEFPNWLSANNVTVYYQLSNPMNTEIKDDNLLRQLNQINTGEFNILDWVIYTDYKDEMVASDTTAELNRLETEVHENYVSNATFETTVNSINGRVEETYSYTTTVKNEADEIAERLEEVNNTVITNQTATEYNINVINQQLINGVVKFNTGTGYTFDIEGLKINKADSVMRLILDNNGLVVYRNNDEVLRADSDGVNAENMTVRKFYVQRPLRIEKTHAITDPTKVGLGIFWVGE